jgi:hypothetical protein
MDHAPTAPSLAFRPTVASQYRLEGHTHALAFFARGDQNTSMSLALGYYFWFTFTRLGSGAGGSI